MGVLDRLFGIDGRSLAAFRIALGTLIAVDLATRAVDLEAHYSDAGVLPREAFRRLFASSPWQWSLHLWTGSVAGEAALFIVAFIAAIALIVGYHTRLATAVCWLLTVSLQARNPMILYGADQLLRLLLFWSLFLPLGAEWSIERRREGERQDRPSRHLSMATAALLLQPVVMYVFSGVLKQNPSWQSGSALAHALASDMFATPLGHRILSYPGLLAQLTPVIPWFESVVPLTLFMPFSTTASRSIALVLLLGFHLVLGALFATGLFQYAAVVALLPFVPAAVWDLLARREAARGRGEDPQRSERRSWLAVSQQGLVAGALLYVVVWNVAGIGLEEYSIRQTMPWIREWWAAGHSGIPLTFRDYVVERRLGALGGIGRIAGLYQRWDMFYRTGPDERGWHVVIGTLADGRRISLLENGRLLEGETLTRPTSVLDLYPSTRWATYFAYLRTQGAESARKLLPEVIAREWAKRRPDLPIEMLRIVFVQDLPSASGGAPEHREVVWFEGGAGSPMPR